MNISRKEYEYVLMLEKWFFGKNKNLEDLAYMIDMHIPMEIDNYQLAVALNTCGWIYDAGCINDKDTSIIDMKKMIKKLLKVKLK